MSSSSTEGQPRIDATRNRWIPGAVEDRLLDALEVAALDAVVAHTYGAVRNLTGGWYSFNYGDFQVAGDRQYMPWLVVERARPDEPVYLCSHLERSEALLAGHPIAEIASSDFGSGFTRTEDVEGLARVLTERDLGASRLGLELGSLPFPAVEALRAALPDAEIVDAGPLLLYVRAVKTTSEIELLRRAAEVVEGALRAVFSVARDGIDDFELEREALVALAERGATPVQRYYLPGVGPGRKRYSAGNPVAHRLRSDDVLLVDLGAKAEGMHGDLVRVGAVGRPKFPIEDAIGLAVSANEEIASVLRPGEPQREAFAEARRIVARHADAVAGWGRPLALHHGLGWSLYEPPFDLSWHGSEQIEGRVDAPIDPYGMLEEGMVFSLETAVVSPDGSEMYCNIEDPYVLTAEGCERLNTMPHDLVECGSA